MASAGGVGPLSYADPRQFHASLAAAAARYAPSLWAAAGTMQAPPAGATIPPPAAPPAGPAAVEPALDIEGLVTRREMERGRRNFALADAIREQLRARGVTLYDKEGYYTCQEGGGNRPYPRPPSL